MPTEKRTDKELLVKGIKQMAITAILMFTGPTLIYLALTDKEQAVFIPLISIGFIISGFAVYMGFRGIRTIMDSMFKSEKSDSN